MRRKEIGRKPNKSKCLQYFLLLLLSFSVPFFTFSQTKTEYKGHYQISDELEGKAIYTYILKNGDRIKDGSFLFYMDEADSVVDNLRFRTELNGEFSEGSRTGEWVFSHKRLTATGEPFIHDLTVARNGNGNQFKISGFFEKGKAQSKWVANRTEINKGKISDTLFFASTSFSQNQFTGEVIAQNKENQLFGRLNEKGLFTGEWIIFHNDSLVPTVEYLIYDEGVLTAHKIRINNQTYTVKYIGLDQSKSEEEEWEQLPLNNDYWDVLYYSSLEGINEKNENLSPQIINDLLDKSHVLLGNTFDAFTEHRGMEIWGSEVTFGLPKVQLRKFPYSNEERKQIDQAYDRIEFTDSVLNNFLASPQVEVNRNSYKEIALYYEVYREYRSEFDKLKKIFELLKKPAFEYVNRSELLPEIFAGTTYPDSVAYTFEDNLYYETIDFPENLSENTADIQLFLQQLNTIDEQIKELESRVQPILEKNKLRTELSRKESELIVKRDTLLYLFSTEKNKENLNKYHLRFADKVSDFVSKKFREYAHQSLNERIESLDKTIACFDQFHKLYKKLKKLPAQISRVEEIYTRTVWNPYTFTDMDEIVKDRIYDAYRDVLIDHLLDQIDSSISCEKIEGKAENFEILFNRMKELRQQDTKDIERKLRRTSDPKIIIDALGLSFNGNK